MKCKFKLITIISILCCLICVYATGCKTYYWTINHTVEEISSISVVEIIDLNEERKFDCKVLSDIDKQFYKECVNDILNLQAVLYYGPPAYHPVGNAFKIVFSNGEYDLITMWEPRHWKLDEQGKIATNQLSRLHFDDEQFNVLIEKWANYNN